MKPRQAPDRPSCERSLWLEIRLRDRVQLFELAPGDERAIVVGSSPGAHLRVGGPAVAPIAFHFEHDETGVYVAPGYQTHLRVNAAPVRSRSRLPRAALLEFSDVALDVRVLDEKPAGDDRPFEELKTAEHVRSYTLDQALDAATVRLAVPGLNTPAPELSTSTLALPAPAADDPFLQTQILGTQPSPEPNPLLAQRFEPAPATPRVHAPARAPEKPPANTPSLNEATTTFEAVGLAPPAPQAVAAPSEPALHAPAAVQPKPSPPRIRAPTTAAPNWLARLGLLTKARPLPVALGAAALALLVGTGIAKFSRSPAPQPRPSAGAALRPSAPTNTEQPPAAPAPTSIRHAPQPSITALRLATPPASSTRPSRKHGEAHGPELVLAVSHLAAGRYAEASRAYAELAKRGPEAAGFETIALLLERASDPQCRPSDVPKPACPEVQR